MTGDFDSNWQALELAIPEAASRVRRLLEVAQAGAQQGRSLDAASRQEMNVVAGDLTALRGQAAAEATEALRALSPRAALRLAQVAPELTREPSLSILTQHAGLDRFIWVVAAGGGADPESKDQDVDLNLSSYLRASARWCACGLALSLASEADPEVPLIIGLNADLEATRRQMSTEIRFAWIARLLSQTAAQIVQGDSARFGTLSGVLTARAVDRLFDYLGSYPYVGSMHTFLAGAQTLDAEVQALMLAMSVEEGSLRHASFEDLVIGVRGEVAPYVAMDGLALPMGIRQATLAPEHALFELVRSQVPNEKDRSDLFEEVVAKCLGACLSDSFSVLQAPINAPIPGSPGDPGEIDFALLSADDVLLVGEVKAYLVSRRPDSVINAFGEQLAKASDQLLKRVDAIRSGVPLTAASEAYSSLINTRVFGIGVPMHSYATAIWNKAALEEVGASRHDLAIVPLHQLMLMASLMADAGDLARYLAMRSAVIDAGLQVFDEADLLLAYLTNTFGDPENIGEKLATGPKELRILRGASVDPGAAILVPRPASPTLWGYVFHQLCFS